MPYQYLHYENVTYFYYPCIEWIVPHCISHSFVQGVNPWCHDIHPLHVYLSIFFIFTCSIHHSICFNHIYLSSTPSSLVLGQESNLFPFATSAIFCICAFYPLCLTQSCFLFIHFLIKCPILCNNDIFSLQFCS